MITPNMQTIGNRIRELRKAKHIKLEDFERHSDGRISVSTLQRLEAGSDTTGIGKIYAVTSVLGVSISELFADGNASTVNRVEDVHDPEKLLQTIARFNTAYECSAANDDVPDTVPEDDQKLYNQILESVTDRQRLFYPQLSRSDNLLCPRYRIMTLAQLWVYLPLMDPAALVEALCRVQGDIFTNEDYFLQQLDHVYDSMPDSPAKKYADYVAMQLDYPHFEQYYQKNLLGIDAIDPDDAKAQLNDDELTEGYDDYARKLAALRQKLASLDSFIGS